MASDVVMLAMAGISGGLATYLWLDWRVIGPARQRQVDQALDFLAMLGKIEQHKTVGSTSTNSDADVLRPTTSTDPLFAEMLTRLLDAALPRREDAATDDNRPDTPAEYEPPAPVIGDWTDPFFGLDRELVGGLRPGEGIPGIGAQADTMEHYVTDPPMTAEEMEARAQEWLARQEMGEDLFEDWEAGRDG